MLSTSKKNKLASELKSYHRQYLNGKITELDESGTRLMINSFLTAVLGYVPIEEVKTEYMIKGTYADYMIQLKGTRHFLVEVKALSLNLSDKHLRQAVNYGANEGIEWALLTNGKQFDLYKILFNKPIESRKVLSIDLSDASQHKVALEWLQFLHRDAVGNKGLELLWNKNCALDPEYVSGLLYAPSVTNFIKKVLKDRFKAKFSDEEVNAAVSRIITEQVKFDNVKPFKAKTVKKRAAAPVQSLHETGLTVLQHPEEPQENCGDTSSQN